MSEHVNIKLWKKHKKVAKSTLTKITNFVNGTEATEDNRGIFKCKLENFEAAFNQFKSSYLELGAILHDEDVDDSEYLEVEENYYFIRNKLQEIVSFGKDIGKVKVNKEEVSAESDNITQKDNMGIKVPKIEIGKFKGNTDQWLKFYDKFMAVIHENKSLKNIHKFHYLISCLEGEAADIIDGIEIKGDNYEFAWETLVKRYKNDKNLIMVHLGNIFNAKKLETQNSNGLRELHNIFLKIINSLRKLEIEFTDKGSNASLLYLLTTKLDKLTLKEWEIESSKSRDLSTYEKLERFVFERYSYLESYEKRVEGNKPREVKINHRMLNKTKTNIVMLSQSSNKCLICNGNFHPVYTCKTFLRETIANRRNIIKDIKCCWQCLGFGHQVTDCNGRVCSNCKGKHNYLICEMNTNKNKFENNSLNGSNSNKSEKEVAATSKEQNFKNDSKASFFIKEKENTSLNLSKQAKSEGNDVTPTAMFFVKQIEKTYNKLEGFIPTVVVLISDKNGNFYEFRFILDTGSELNFLTNHSMKLLMLQTYDESIRINGINNLTTDVNKVVYTTLKSRINRFKTKIKFNLIDKITNETFHEFDEDNNLNYLPDWLIQDLADKRINGGKQKIDGILGAGVFFEVLQNETYNSNHSPGLSFRKTSLGWIAVGKLNNTNFKQNSGCLLNKTEGSLQVLGSLKHLTKGEIKAIQDEKCEQMFSETVKRNNEGRFIVKLPIREDSELKLGNSLESAKRRFFNLERKLGKNEKLALAYSEFLAEYKTLGHMEEIPVEELNKEPNYYLPHHPVLRESETTKLRVVFDASHKSDNGLSLNDILLVGPSLQNELFSLLISFRKYKFGLMGDIEKMYRQIWVDKEHTEFQRIVWRESPEETLTHYRLKTVTYGTNSAPFLAIRCLREIAEIIKDQDSKLSLVIKEKFYMDDLIFGADSIEELQSWQVKISNKLEEFGFHMRKWCTNAERTSENWLINKSDPHFYIDLDKNCHAMALGLLWNPDEDVFVFEYHSLGNDKELTKRKIISDIQRFWDPIGLWAPIFIRGKMFVSELWEEKFNWDDPLPHDLAMKWFKFRNDMQCLNGECVPRKILSKNKITKVVLHGFSDASNKAYGCCIYALSLDIFGKYHSTLICAKARVTPKVTESLPRLELMGAVLLIKLMHKMIEALQYSDKECHYWTDSEIVLNWISGRPQQWKTFVANRVQVIQNHSNINQWHHISSGDNPADLASRGVCPKEFINNKLWWEGPINKMIKPIEWRKQDELLESDNNLEKRKIKYSLLVTNNLINNYSSFRKLWRVTALLFRFIKNCKLSKDEREIGQLTYSELLKTKLFLIKSAQESKYSEEINRLKIKKPIQRSSELLSLSVFLDEQGLLRVGGRLNKADISSERKHPIILPYKNKITELIIREFHIKHFHVGPQSLLTIIRGKYWPIRGKSATKSVVHDCIICKKSNPISVTPFMASLPEERVKPARAFENTGIDFCGPFFIKAGLRKSVKQKVYVAVFICFVSKAIHLELVSDLSSQAFLAALYRFFSRRGMSRNIYSDNGTNFVGVQRELKLLIEDKIIKQRCLEDGIEWHFIPPGAPHFGGLWESAVKLLKGHLRKAIHNNILTFEELYTILTRIESCLNSRPLTPISDDPNDPSPLTPAHFLIGAPLLSPPEQDLTNYKPLTKRWQRVQQISQEFWKRWSSEYLSSLQKRHKWRFQKANLPIGTLVTIKEEGLKPLQWKMGRIVRLHPGSDGVVRVATVKLQGGEVLRPIVKLCPILQVEEENASS